MFWEFWKNIKREFNAHPIVCIGTIILVIVGIYSISRPTETQHIIIRSASAIKNTPSYVKEVYDSVFPKAEEHHKIRMEVPNYIKQIK